MVTHSLQYIKWLMDAYAVYMLASKAQCGKVVCVCVCVCVCVLRVCVRVYFTGLYSYDMLVCRWLKNYWSEFTLLQL